ncbi:MAG: hypothetical protein HOP33_11020 [Verrucomicrobia bacterium]|nr:hypothetical protein [Verrucomicrobiota bacterium]
MLRTDPFKEIHVNSGLYYYGYRFYSPSLQRWLNRDPKREPGFELSRSGKLPHNPIWVRLYVFVRNNPVKLVDPQGLSEGTGPFTGTCCNKGKQNEWALVAGDWFLLPPGECTVDSFFMTDQDCDGMTCKGGFYTVGNLGSMDCTDKKLPGQKCNHYDDYRWTPNNPGGMSEPPGPPARPGQPGGKHRGGRTGHKPPPGYPWDPSHPISTKP